MHRFGSVFAVFLGSLLFLVGCASRQVGLSPIRRVYVEEAVGAPAPGLAGSAAVIHDTSVRTLRSLGYADAREPDEADAFLRASWFVRPASAGSIDGRVTLRISLVGRDGGVLRTVDVVTDAPAGFLTEERIADLVREKLAKVTP